MSPQFVDFDADGDLDIMAGTFDGSPHVALATGAGWKQPQQILDQNGERILLNQFWNYDAEKWDSTKRCDAPDAPGEGQCTSAYAMDWDGDGDLDLLLGDYRGGYLYRRMNEGTAAKHKFALVNVPVLAGGKPLCVPKKMATMRLVDWNRDGLLDLVCGSIGDDSGGGTDGGVFLFLNQGTNTGPVFDKPVVLVAASPRSTSASPNRPNTGLYVDAGDQDGDGDLDLVVGGYSHWQPSGRELTAEEKTRATLLQERGDGLQRQQAEIYQEIEAATKGLDAAAAEKKREQLFQSREKDLLELNQKHAALANELDSLVPAPKRVGYVWFYENLTRSPGQ